MVDSPTEEWRRSVDDYRRLSSFTFQTEDDLGLALTAFDEEGSPINEAPFDIVPENTVFVPREAANLWVHWLKAHNIFVEPEPVAESRDLPADEVAEGRRLNYMPSL